MARNQPSKEMIVIGITGTLGAGKGTIVDYLTREKGFLHFSVRDYLTREIIGRGLPVNRDTMTQVANQLRAANSPSFVTDQLLAQAEKSGKNCIIESIRTPGEIASLRRSSRFVLFAVDAQPDTRYHRITLRGSATDQVSFETFIANEQREMASTDPNHQNLSACIRQADFTFNNDGTLDELCQSVDRVLQQLEL